MTGLYSHMWYDAPEPYEEICPICDDPLEDRGYSNLVTDENGTTVHEDCLPEE